MPSFPDATVMVVDDYRFMRHLLIKMLEDLGFQNFLEAEDGEQALEVAKQSKVDLIVSDLQMPRMDGVEFVRQLRQVPEIATIPVLIITAEHSTKVEDEVREAGGNAFLGKPFSVEDLQVAVTPLLRA